MSDVMTEKEIISRLKKENRWLVRASNNGISLAKMLAGKAVTINLVKQDNGKYRLIFPSYLFVSKISHFTPSQEEYRFCRNKALLIALIHVLKRSFLWNIIDNQGFMTINDENARSDKEALRKQIKKLIG